MPQQPPEQLVRERGRRIKAAAELGLARSSRGRQWGRALGRRGLGVSPSPKEAVASTGNRQARLMRSATTTPLLEGRGKNNDDEEEEAVEEKVALLRQLVPGGEDMAVEGLLEETADYIAALKAQVGVMRALACLLSPEKAAGLLTPEKPL